MTNGEQKVLELLKKNPNATIKILSQDLNISIRTIQRILASLKEKDVIVRKGSDKTGYWEVING